MGARLPLFGWVINLIVAVLGGIMIGPARSWSFWQALITLVLETAMTSTRIPQDLPSVAYLRECFSYDPETGVLTWKERPREHFSSDPAYRRFTTRYAGKVAGGPNNEGYHYVKAGRGLVGAHRAIWAMITGAWPDPGLQIDHIDLNKSNNRISNLTLVSPHDNARRRSRSKLNNSGVTGVFYGTARKRWIAKIGNGTGGIELGAYLSFEEAVAARRAAELVYGYAHNHGTEKTTVVDEFLTGHTRRDNSSGVTGCYFSHGRGKWRAYIYVSLRCVHLGYHDTLEQAAAARRAAEIEYGVTNRKGRGKVCAP